MIGRLRGFIAEIDAEECVVDVMGVGYVVRCGARTLNRLSVSPQEVVFHVEQTWSSEQGARLLGFLTRDERAAFRLLTAIQGVGPKAALAVLDVLSPAELAGAVARDDKAAIGRANGVGPKLAQRIAVELKGKPLAGGALGTLVDPAPAPGSQAGSIAGDAIAALIGLGITEPMARRAVDQALTSAEDPGLPVLIRLALKEIGR